MLFWINTKLEKAMPKRYKYKQNASDVNKNHIKNKYTPFESEKAFYRQSLSGSMTVEASLVLSLVFWVWIACVAWTSIVYVHTTMQQKLGDMAIEAAVAAGKYEDFVHNTSILASWIQSMNMDDLEHGGIDKVYNFDFSESHILENDSMILLKVYYRIRILEGIVPIPSIRLSNQVYTRAWTGSISKLQENDRIFETDDSVYVTEYGNVYHTDRMCSHIYLTIYMVGENETKDYIPCDKCTGQDTDQGHTFYITKEGDHYHRRLGCSGLKRQVDSMPMTQVSIMGYRPCSRCSGGE